MFKKATALLLSLVLIISLVPIGMADETNQKTSVFKVMPNDWSTLALQNAVDNGLLNGFDGKIKPKGNITRAEIATVINRAFGAKEVTSLESYRDIKKSD